MYEPRHEQREPREASEASHLGIKAIRAMFGVGTRNPRRVHTHYLTNLLLYTQLTACTHELTGRYLVTRVL